MGYAGKNEHNAGNTLLSNLAFGLIGVMLNLLNVLAVYTSIYMKVYRHTHKYIEYKLYI